jgi:hypothetical protein
MSSLHIRLQIYNIFIFFVLNCSTHWQEGYTVVVSSFCPASLARAPAGKYSLRLFAVGASPSASSEPQQQQQPLPIHSLQPEPINVVSEYSDGYQRNVNRVLFRYAHFSLLCVSFVGCCALCFSSSLL